ANLLKVAESEGFEPSRPRKRPTRFPIVLLRPLGQLSMAPQVGFEPTTDRLTADCSTTELLWNEISLAASYSCRGEDSTTIGAEELYSRVRYLIRCNLFDTVIRHTMKLKNKIDYNKS